MAERGRKSRSRRMKLPPVAPLVRVGATLAAFLLGVYGFSVAYRQLGMDTTLWNNAFRSVRLIVGNFPDALEGRDLPLALHVARWALPLLTFWTTIALAWVQIRNPARLYFMRARGDHLIVAGDERLAARLVANALEDGNRVLIWSIDRHAAWVKDAVEQGAAEITLSDDLATTGLALDKARTVLLLGPDDSANIALAAAVLEGAATQRPAGDPLPVITRVDDLDLRRGVEARFARNDHRTARIRFASIPDIAARQLFIDRPLDSFRAVTSADRLVLAFGFSPMVERFMLRQLAGGHFRDGGKPRFIVAAAGGAAAEQRFRARNPGADTLSPVQFREAAIDQPALAGTFVDDLVRERGEIAAVIVDPGEDARALAIALAMEDAYRRRDRPCPPIHVRMDARYDSRLGISILPFGGREVMADPEMLMQEAHDTLARSIHDFYLEGRLGEGERIGARASMQEWEDLSESFRDDNRLVADCYALKLRDIGARLVSGSGPTLRLEAEELEELARAEHDRWMAAKLTDGWVHGPERDDRARVHPDIVPYDALSERIKDLDREQVRIMTRMLASSGRRALRCLDVALDPDAGMALAGAMPALLAALVEHYPDRVPVILGNIADPASRDAMAAAQRSGQLVQIVTSTNIQSVIDALAGDDRTAARQVAAHADMVETAAAAQDISARLAARAHIWVTGRDGGAPPALPHVTLAANGTITAAPWLG